MRKTFLGLMILGSAAVYAQKPAVVTSNEPGWKKIGETTASFKEQDESIMILGADEFSAIKLNIKDAPIDIERLQVFYESGDMEEIEVQDINDNGESEVINLKHPDRDIKKVAFTYKTEANAEGEKAKVELFGLKTNQPQGKDAYRDDAERVEEKVNEAERSVENAGQEVEEEAEETGNEIRNEANEEANEVEAETDTAEQNARSAAREIGDNVAEGAGDAAAAIRDKKLANKVGPGGETAYIDDDGKYYYINDQGNKVYVTVTQLKDKVDNK